MPEVERVGDRPKCGERPCREDPRRGVYRREHECGTSETKKRERPRRIELSRREEWQACYDCNRHCGRYQERASVPRKPFTLDGDDAADNETNGSYVRSVVEAETDRTASYEEHAPHRHTRSQRYE